MRSRRRFHDLIAHSPSSGPAVFRTARAYPRQRFTGRFHVQMRRQADVDQVDLGINQHLFERFVNLQAANINAFARRSKLPLMLVQSPARFAASREQNAFSFALVDR